MNKTCNGEYFKVRNTKLYRCQYDSAVIPDSWILGKAAICPNCHRKVTSSTDHGVVDLQEEVVRFVMLGEKKIIINDGIFPKDLADDLRKPNPHTRALVSALVDSALRVSKEIT